MMGLGKKTVQTWLSLGPKYLPFADAASAELPMLRLLRLGLFQVTVGMATVLLTGTLNRVMILEMGVPAWFVALMVSLPLLIAPLRLLIGHASDQHRSAFGWRRVPYLWYGTMSIWGGFAIMPFALLVLTDAPLAPQWAGPVAAGASFFLVGLGIHLTQTAGLALATDLAPVHTRPRVVALLYMMLVLGMFVSAQVFGYLLRNFSPLHLIQVVQGTAAVSLVVNVIALWKQEPRNRVRATAPKQVLPFKQAWAGLMAQPGARRMLVAVGLGAASFSMQDILLEPYGGHVLGLTVSGTTFLTGLAAAGSLTGFALSAYYLKKGVEPPRLASFGALIGIVAFATIILSAPFSMPNVFRVGVLLVGLGSGAYAHAMLVAVMQLAEKVESGLALGAWGAVQATAAGIGVALGGSLRDGIATLAEAGSLGVGLKSPYIAYSAIYHLEIIILFASLITLGPIVRRRNVVQDQSDVQFSELPG
jgi:MFS transporter, BCD family, chlorophyll transporter